MTGRDGPKFMPNLVKVRLFGDLTGYYAVSNGLMIGSLLNFGL